MRNTYPAKAGGRELAATSECVPNIGPQGRARRTTFGVVLLVLGAAIAIALLAADAPRPWRLAVLPVFWGGALGVFQAYFHT